MGECKVFYRVDDVNASNVAEVAVRSGKQEIAMPLQCGPNSISFVVEKAGS